MTIKTCLYCKEKYDDDTHCEPCPHVKMAAMYGRSELPLSGDALQHAIDDDFNSASAESELDRLAKIPNSRPLTLADIVGNPKPTPPEDPDELVDITLIGGLFDGEVLRMKAIHAHNLDEIMPQVNGSGKTRVAIYCNKHDGTFVFDQMGDLEEIKGTIFGSVSKSEIPQVEPDDEEEDEDEYGLFNDTPWTDS
jgi:hypothetical protein